MQHCVDSPQQFCLRWNNYQSNLTNVFDQLLQSESFVDVTLACDGHSVKAHKMVLSACSPYFQSLFFDNPCQHPIVILKDIKWPELKAAVEFMYKGEINVSQEQIGPLLKVAESLKIRGLADVNGEPEFGGSGDGGKKTSSAAGWDSRHHGTPAPHDLSESAASPSPSQLAAHRQKKRRRTSGERSSVSSPEENSLVGVDGMETNSGVLELSPHPPPPPGPGLAPPPSSHNMITDTLPLPPPPPPSSHPDDMEIKPGIAEMIREEERAKLLESSHAWLGASTSSIAADSYQYQLQSMWQKCWNTNQSLVHNLRFRERGPLKSWRPETMAEAIFSVLKEGLSLSQAARKYDIPYPTFVLYANRVHNMLGPSADGGADLRPKGRGRPQRILLGSWPEDHIRGVIRAVVFRDPQHIKEEPHMGYPRLSPHRQYFLHHSTQKMPNSNLLQNHTTSSPLYPTNGDVYLDSLGVGNYGQGPCANGPDPSVSPGAAAAAAVAVVQGIRQQMCSMVAAAQHGHGAGLSEASLAGLVSHCLPSNGSAHGLPPLSLPSPASPGDSSPAPSPSPGNLEVGIGVSGMTYKPPMSFTSPRPETLFQEDIEDIVGSPDSLVKSPKDNIPVKVEPIIETSQND